MLKMRVKLATQIFSESVAKGLQFYAKRGAPRLYDVEPTVQFTSLMNNLFDALNRRFPAEGVRLGGEAKSSKMHYSGLTHGKKK
ncbi:hypothetical protein HPB48_003446 [Haemaphysalis longicornis]|uniref:Transposable element P transposase-like GTP-binding insertion domain-containing protein n=1 Tax=Haemaphysalis longicornis TaxID=44386 RepID=A0A9J6GBJ6_HAELO|nr:hypothetical protein HPB48_003446 [Haemaphysalis longicornis]